ncbi:MAG TPA: hypothetical protein VF832_13295, partial [Longimicrobiales bacterium]
LVGYLNAVVQGQPLGVFYGGMYERNANGSIYYQKIAVAGFADSLRLPMRRRAHSASGAYNIAGTALNGIIGDPNPKWTASMNNVFTLGKNVQLNVLLDGRFGNKVANFTRRISEFFGADAHDAREITGDTVPRTFALNPAGRISIYEEYVEDGSFVKLREAALSLHVPPDYARWVGAGSAELRFAGRNLYTWTKYSGLDPEVNLFGANTVAQGVDFANTPIPRQFVVGVTLHY